MIVGCGAAEACTRSDDAVVAHSCAIKTASTEARVILIAPPTPLILGREDLSWQSWSNESPPLPNRTHPAASSAADIVAIDADDSTATRANFFLSLFFKWCPTLCTGKKPFSREVSSTPQAAVVAKEGAACRGCQIFDTRAFSTSQLPLPTQSASDAMLACRLPCIGSTSTKITTRGVEDVAIERSGLLWTAVPAPITVLTSEPVDFLFANDAGVVKVAWRIEASVLLDPSCAKDDAAAAVATCSKTIEDKEVGPPHTPLSKVERGKVLRVQGK
jgi:hypothetical protein